MGSNRALLVMCMHKKASNQKYKIPLQPHQIYISDIIHRKYISNYGSVQCYQGELSVNHNRENVQKPFQSSTELKSCGQNETSQQ